MNQQMDTTILVNDFLYKEIGRRETKSKMGQANNKIEVMDHSIYNPDFFVWYYWVLKDNNNEDKEAYTYFYETNPEIMDQWNKIKHDKDKYKEWLDSEENTVAKQYFTKWYNHIDKLMVSFEIIEYKRRLNK